MALNIKENQICELCFWPALLLFAIFRIFSLNTMQPQQRLSALCLQQTSFISFIFSVASFWHFRSCTSNCSFYSIFLAHSSNSLLCICRAIYCLVKLQSFCFHSKTSLIIDSLFWSSHSLDSMAGTHCRSGA